MKPPQAAVAAAVAVIEYLLGFLALAVFAALALAPGTPTSDARWIFAFQVSGALALVELAILSRRSVPVNRLIAGANLWLIAGAAAAVLEQWWWLQGYQRWGEPSLFVSILLVGAITTVFSSTGFIGVEGPRQQVLRASYGLFAGCLFALACSMYFRGDARWAGVVPVIGLSWLHRLLKKMVIRSA